MFSHISVKSFYPLTPYNPDTDSYKDNLTHSFHFIKETLFESFDPHTSIKTIAQPQRTLPPSPNYQVLPDFITSYWFT